MHVARCSGFAACHRRALAEDPHLKAGLNVAGGKVTYKAVAEAHGLPYVAPEEALAL